MSDGSKGCRPLARLTRWAGCCQGCELAFLGRPWLTVSIGEPAQLATPLPQLTPLKSDVTAHSSITPNSTEKSPTPCNFQSQYNKWANVGWPVTTFHSDIYIYVVYIVGCVERRKDDGRGRWTFFWIFYFFVLLLLLLLHWSNERWCSLLCNTPTLNKSSVGRKRPLGLLMRTWVSSISMDNPEERVLGVSLLCDFFANDGGGMLFKNSILTQHNRRSMGSHFSIKTSRLGFLWHATLYVESP